jgi:hypothetical protein
MLSVELNRFISALWANTRLARNEVRYNIMKKHDNSLDWSDNKMYNAELVWKIY